MALNIKAVTLTQSGTSTGSQTIELGDNFDPKCGIVVAAPVAADGIAAHASLSVGVFSFRGSVVQQGYSSNFAEDNQATSDAYSRMNTDACAVLMDGTGAVDFNLSFTGLTAGVGADVTFNVTNAHTTSNIRVFILVFGGSDVEDAQAHSYAVGAGNGTQDVTLGSGFGHPGAVFMMSNAWALSSAARASASGGFGWGITGGDDRHVAFSSHDAQGTEATSQRISNDAARFAMWENGATGAQYILSAESGYPTDGYEITKTNVDAGNDEAVIGLALRFSANVTVTSGEGAARTTTGTTDLSVGSSVPRGLVLAHTRQTTANATDTTSADAAFAGIGLLDGDGNERWTGWWDDDGQATASVASSAQSTTKAIRTYAPSTDTLDGEADGLVSGSNFQLDWTDAAPSAFLYEWVAFGELVAADPVPPFVGVARYR